MFGDPRSDVWEGSGVMVTWNSTPQGKNDGQTRLKTLSSHNFVGGRYKILLSDVYDI